MIECVIERNISASEKWMRTVMIALTAFLGVIGIATIIMLPAFLAALIATTYYCRRLKDEFEYGFNRHTGNLNIACIMNGAKRKTKLDANVEQFRRICPYSKSTILHRKGTRVEDYASKRVDARVYVIETADDRGRPRCIIFEPSDEMLEELYRRAPDRVELAE